MQPKAFDMCSYGLSDLFYGETQDGLNVLGLKTHMIGQVRLDGGVRYWETDRQGNPRVRDSWGNTPSYARQKAENYQRHGIKCIYLERPTLYWYERHQLKN